MMRNRSAVQRSLHPELPGGKRRRRNQPAAGNGPEPHSRNAAPYLAFDIGGTNCTVALGTRDGAILDSRTVPTNHASSPKKMIESLCELGAQLIDGSRLGRPAAAGISCGGPLDARRGIVYSPPNLPDWEAVPVVKLVQRRLNIPAMLQNDANAGALAEWRFGAGRGTQNMVFLTFGTGLGAGLILGGRLYSGTNDMAGEVGHVRMERAGPVGYGKEGSFEGFCSGAGIGRLAQEIVADEWRAGRDTPFCHSETERLQLDARTIGHAALAGDSTAQRIIQISAEYLGRGLGMIVDILNPERIVIGSIFVRLEALIRPYMEAALRSEALSRSLEVCTVVPAELGEEVGVLAALSVAMQTRNSDVVGASGANEQSKKEESDEHNGA